MEFYININGWLINLEHWLEATKAQVKARLELKLSVRLASGDKWGFDCLELNID